MRLHNDFESSFAVGPSAVPGFAGIPDFSMYHGKAMGSRPHRKSLEEPRGDHLLASSTLEQL